MTGAIPPGYYSRLEAIQRAKKKWGQHDALGKLKGLLVSGELIGWDGLSPQRLRILRPEFWTKHDSWGVLEGERTPQHRGPNPHLLFKEEDLNRVFPTESEMAVIAPAEMTIEIGAVTMAEGLESKTRVGNPGKYDWEEMWIEIATMFYYDVDFPSLQRKEEVNFRKKIQQRFVDKVGSNPDDNLIVPKIKRLFERLRNPPIPD
jgi:hypothetical protein